MRGVVQGVGFRPFVYRQATALGLGGWVGNTTDGVTVEAEGGETQIAALVAAIRTSPPAAARVIALEERDLIPSGETAFAIRQSAEEGARSAEVPADLATCADCLAELFDPLSRRFHYPFINCTQCGPRFSIITDMPYDRARTTMATFAMCLECQAEYDDPGDRRFHAEPNACLACGPQVALWDSSGRPLDTGGNALRKAADAIRTGALVAVKGIGGFHLVCDARNGVAVVELRARKQREEKPFAVMFPDLRAVTACCRVGPAEEALLTGPERPIVLLRRTGGPIAEAVVPGNPRLGAFLPYTPLHHLLMADLGFPVVATSGNVSDEPIVIDEHEAAVRLAGIADLFLVHDRPIVRPVDDSVVHVVAGEPQVLRRGRGTAPARIAVNGIDEGIVAVGGHLKTTVAVSQAGGVVLGAHVGDLDTARARDAHATAVADLTRLYAVAPRQVARDLHPDYASNRVAESLGVPIVPVQHHLAHIVACTAEHGIESPVLGVAFDGTGYGGDGTVWGGEFLLVERGRWRRVGHLRHFRLPGGEAAVREPRRAAFGLLAEAFGPAALDMTDLAPLAGLDEAERAVMGRMVERGVNAPETSSAGRLLDAFAALCGLCQVNAYEGQAASMLEWAAGDRPAEGGYSFTVAEAPDGMLVVDWRQALEDALADLRAGAPRGRVAAAVHDGLVAAIGAVAERVGEPHVVLSGGCFQNVRLTEGAVALLGRNGFEPVWHRRIPPNDGGIALGQAVWAGWTEETGA